MRGWFYALLLVNVVFFGWAHWIDAPAAAPVASSTTRALPTLALVHGSGAGAADESGRAATSGRGAARSRAAAGAAAPNGASAGKERCRSLGPFADAASATRAAGRLRERGIAPSERDVDISVNDGYTVYVDQAGGAAAVRATLARLQHAGIAGVHPGSGPAGADRISFGVFSDQSHAVRRAEQIRQLGLKPVLDIHQSTVTTRWLDLTLQPSQPIPLVAQLLGSDGAGGSAASSRGAGGALIQFSDCPAQDASP